MPSRGNWEGANWYQFGKLRAYVLARDGYRCQVRIPGTCQIWAPLHETGGIPAGHAHHTHGRGKTGDDPRFIVASCAACNRKIGDPTKANPQFKQITQWGKKKENSDSTRREYNSIRKKGAKTKQRKERKKNKPRSPYPHWISRDD